MDGNLREFVRTELNSVLKVTGYELLRIGESHPNVSYISLRKTLAGAKKAGMSVGDYIDARFNAPGATQQTMDCLAEMGIFQRDLQRICEIGPGSGRYLAKTLKLCQPDHYEIYETDLEWAKWLVSEFRVIAQPSNGIALNLTPSDSIDLVHAHKVFSCLPLLSTCRYFFEMARVVKQKGLVVFDVLSEDCLDRDTLQKWFATGAYYPTFMAKQFVMDLFSDLGLTCIGSFFIPLGPGRTEYLVFEKGR